MCIWTLGAQSAAAALATEFLCWQKSEEKSLGRGRISLAGAFRFAWVSQSVVY
jgi:hypothetical protein